MGNPATRRGRLPVEEITAPQRRTLKLIHDWTLREGYPPALHDLAATLGITKASVYDQLKHLQNKGYIRREPGRARGITILRAPEDEVRRVVPVPIVGRVAASTPILAQENLVGEVLVEVDVTGGHRCFALEVQGDSMTGAGIHAGDLIIVRQQPVAKSGDIVVALLGDEATVKRLHIEGIEVELRPENRKHRPISVRPEDDLRILGKVVAVRRLKGRTRRARKGA